MALHNVLRELDGLRRHVRAMLLAQRASVMVAWLVAALAAVILVDFALRLPSAVRAVLLAGGVAALATATWRLIVPALGFRPSLTQLALRVEQALPGISGRLASGVEFAVSGADRDNPLAARSVREAETRLEGERLRRVLRPARTVRDAGVCAAMIAAAATLAAMNPAAAATGLSRIFLPYGAATWPARTAVESLMSEVVMEGAVHPRGQVLPLRARNLTPGDPEGRVEAVYRSRRDGASEPWQRAVLTHQTDGVHERLVDTDADEIEVWFTTEDARTDVERVRLVDPPAVVRATLHVEPPAYALGRVPALDADLGPGVDDRAVTATASLVGSAASIAFEMNKPLPAPPAGDAAREEWLRSTFGWTGPALPAFRADDGDPRRWEIGWTVEGPVTIDVDLVDDFGLHNRERIQYRVTAVMDLPPSVTITEPAADVPVLADALVALATEAKDDVAVARVSMTAAVHRGGSEGADPLEFAPSRDVDARAASLDAELDLSRFELSTGDVVVVHALAADTFESGGVRREPVTSAPRQLRIIDELEFTAQLRRQLSAVRQNAIRIESLQSELQDDVIDHGPQAGADRAQAQLAERIAAQRDAVEELREQFERNRLDDAQIEEIVRQSGDLLDYAGRAASQAVEAIRARPPGASTPPPAPADEEGGLRAPAPEDRPIVEAQQEVRDELADLIELLDRDEDTWIVQRQLESLIGEQTQLAGETGELAERTIGQAIESLPEADLTELERIVARQRELRDEIRRLVEEMRRRADALEGVDPQAASGMRAAADTAEKREVDRDMEDAAARAERNQLQSASASQTAAAQSLQRMLEDLQETKRARAEELLRRLASLVESIDRLIAVQENEIIALADAQARGDFTGRDRAMIRLTQNTQAIAAEARSAGQESRRIARALDRAADAQGAAVGALRADPVDAVAADEAEERSLAQLEEARTLAEELAKETQDDQVRQQREALIARYRELAEKQIAVRTETIAIGEAEMDRRRLVEARRMGNVQEEIRTALLDVESTTSEITESEVFSFVHRLMDEWSRLASAALWEGLVDADVTDRQQKIADSIARQIEAIEEALVPPDEFARESQPENQGGEGASQPPPLIPPVAELKRLHGLQEQIYNDTRSLDGRDDLSDARRRQRVRELGEMQRELTRLGEAMLEKLSGGGGPPAPIPVHDQPPPPEPAPPPGGTEPDGDREGDGS
jgi:hypothetical protein